MEDIEIIDKLIARILFQYEDSMKNLEKISEYQEREGKKAVRLIMFINDIKKLIQK